MKKPSQQRLLYAIFNNVFSQEFDASSIDDRVMLQKAVFLMHELGVACGDYTFSWDCYGPFSPDLSDDMKRMVEDDIPVKFSKKAIQVMKRLREIFGIHSEYEKRYWTEAIASLYYLKKYMYPTSTNDNVVLELENLKRYYLNNHTENIKALEAAEILFSE